MKSRLALRCIIAGLSIATASDAHAQEPERARRILLVVVDTLRRDHVSAYNRWVPTPHIDRLSKRGQVFSNVFSSFHQTTMSMGALFSGRAPSAESNVSATPLGWTGRNWCGLARFAELEGDTCVPGKLDTLAERLGSAGYRTVGVVSNAMLFKPQGYEQGFDEWIEVGAGPEVTVPAERTRLRSAPHVLEAVRNILPSLRDQPSFVYVHYVDVHDYLFAGKKYVRAVLTFDEEFGRLLDLLEESGWLDSAVVFFTSDHGETFEEPYHPLPSNWGHGGGPSYESVLRIPLIVAPSRFEDPDRMLRSQDIPRMILETAGIGEATDEAPVLAPDELFLGERHFFVYRKGRWKSIIRRRGLDGAMLFDLKNDPLERMNLAGKKPEILREHISRVATLVRLLGSPPVAGDQLTHRDRRRLRALGYVD